MKKVLISNQPITKADINKLATKKELGDVKKTLWGEILRVESKVEKLDDKVEKLDDKFEKLDDKFEKLDDKFDKMMTKLNKMDNTLVSFVGRVDNLETENEIGSDQIRKLDKRITTLESAA